MVAGGQVKGDVDCLLGSVVLPAGDVRATWALLHEGVGELLTAFGLYEMAWWALGGGVLCGDLRHNQQRGHKPHRPPGCFSRDLATPAFWVEGKTLPVPASP